MTPSPAADLSPGEAGLEIARGAPAPRARWRRVLPGVLLAVGLAVVAWLLWSAGWPAIERNLAHVGWWFPALAALAGLFQGAFALGWLVLMPVRLSARTCARVFSAYIAGDAVNYVTPVNVAGEPLKGRLVADLIGGGEAVVSLALHKNAELLAQCVYMAAGVTLAITGFALPRAAAAIAAAGVAGLVAAFVFMTWALRRGSFAPILGRLTRIAWLARRLSRFEGGAREVDVKIRAFYSEHPWRFALAVACCLAGWGGGLVETAIILRLLTHAASFKTAFAIEALALAAGNMLLFMPGRVGSAEGSRVAVFLLLGFPAAQGVAYSLVRRARELVWAGLGGLVLLKRHVRP